MGRACLAGSSPSPVRPHEPAPPWLLFTRYPLELIDTLRVADGRAVVMRPVMPHDAPAEGDFVSDLSPLSRRLRFHGAVNRLSDAVLDAMTQVDHHHHVALIAQAIGHDGRPQIVADARYVTHRHDDGAPATEAEFAVAVADAWQGMGLGRTLLQRLAHHARGRGLKTLRGAVLAGNEPMLGLMRRLGARVTPDVEDGSVLQVAFAT